MAICHPAADWHSNWRQLASSANSDAKNCPRARHAMAIVRCAVSSVRWRLGPGFWTSGVPGKHPFQPISGQGSPNPAATWLPCSLYALPQMGDSRDCLWPMTTAAQPHTSMYRKGHLTSQTSHSGAHSPATRVMNWCLAWPGRAVSIRMMHCDFAGRPRSLLILV